MKYYFIIISLFLIGCNTNSNSKSDPTSSTASATYNNIDVATFNQGLKGENSVVIDVRTPQEIAGGKIENAVELDYYDKEFASKIKALDPDKNYYLYCKAGTRSAKAAEIMIENGFKNVHNLKGGYTDWKKDSK
ncbi:rhodanese-like domain-containing protein [Portibacter lacus]|nr:rhodanese-like domain-containing protein [Portibacter lacus]